MPRGSATQLIHTGPTEESQRSSLCLSGGQRSLREMLLYNYEAITLEALRICVVLII
jgi:hypothetical protein